MFAFPIGTDRPQRRVPWINILLIAANVIIYFMTHVTTRGQQPGSPFGSLAPFAVPYMLFPEAISTTLNGRLTILGPQLQQFITYQFLHQDIWHLLGNMAFLYVFGNALNEKLGHVGYLAFYLTGGILAGCGHFVLSPSPVLGASGSISAVAGLFLVLLPRTNVRIFFWIFLFIDIFEIPSMWVVLFSFAKDLLFSQLGSGGVAYGAHLTGNVAGFLIGLLLLLAGLIQRDHYDLLALLNRWRRRKAYESMVSRGYDPFAPTGGVRAPADRPTRKTPPVVASPEMERIALLRDETLTLLREHRIAEAADRFIQLRTLDPQHVLPEQDQLDVANQLMADGRYEPAAAAYEDFLRIYTTSHQREQIQLILGLIYARYLPRPERAAEMLKAALTRLHDAGQRAMAESELARLSPPPPPPTS